MKDKAHSTPKIGTSSVSFTMRNAIIGQTLSDFAKSVKGSGVAVSASPAADWYVSDMSTLVCVPFSGKKTKAVTFGLTGPGLFVADSAPSYDHGPITYTYSHGSVKGADADAEIALLVPSGKTTLKLELKGTDEAARGVSAELAYSGVEGEAPFGWIPLSKTTPAFPRDKAVAPASAVTNLSWTVPPAAEDVEGANGLRYRIVMDASKNNLSKAPEVDEETTEHGIPLGGLALEPGSTYYWRVDYIYGPTNGTPQMVEGKEVWSFTVVGDDVPSARVSLGADVFGDAIAPGTVALLYQGVQAGFELAADGADAAKFSLAAGKLPDGMKLAQDKATKKWGVSGTPTKAGRYDALIGCKAGKTVCTTVALSFEVMPIALGAGSFTALLSPDRGSVENAAMSLASVSFSATEAGKLSAKVSAGGKTYSFSSTGYSSVELGTDGVDELEPDAVATLTARLENVQKINKVSYTNVLELSVADAVTNNLYALGAAAGTAKLWFCVPSGDGKSVETEADGEGLLFRGSLYRDNFKIPEVAAELAGMTGYYTVAMVPECPQGGAPEGCGYLTLTVDSKGKIKAAGRQADGASLSFSASAFIAGDLFADSADRTMTLIAPLHKAKAKDCFGGELQIVREISDLFYDEDNSYALVDSNSTLIWADASATAAYDPEADEFGGFLLTLTPVGGWYDKVVNMQAYYKNSAVSVDAGATGVDEELPDGALVLFEGDKLVVAKDAGVTLSFARATGILTGTLAYTADGTTTKGLKHAGVALMNSQSQSYFGRDSDVLTAGYFLRTEKVGAKKVSVSSPFFLLTEQVDPDFAAGDEGDYEGLEVPAD